MGNNSNKINMDFAMSAKFCYFAPLSRNLCQRECDLIRCVVTITFLNLKKWI